MHELNLFEIWSIIRDGTSVQRMAVVAIVLMGGLLVEIALMGWVFFGKSKSLLNITRNRQNQCQS